MSHKITEDAIELLAIERLEAEGYSYLYGPSIAPSSIIRRCGRTDFDLNQAQIRMLENLHQTLLPKLMRSEVRVRL